MVAVRPPSGPRLACKTPGQLSSRRQEQASAVVSARRATTLLFGATPPAPAPSRRLTSTLLAAATPPGPAQQQQQQPPPPPPAAPPPVYPDTLTDRAFIALCRLSYGKLAGWQSPRAWWDGPESYKGMVEVSRALMRGRPTAAAQRGAVIAGFPPVPPWFRRAFPYSQWGAELNARITPAFFAWLVGPASVASGPVDGGAVQASTVKIERCRYLAESGCVAMCANLCKGPVQAFFTDELGMPLTMVPDFETCGCEMVFGKTPPPLAEDPGLGVGCLGDCPTGRSDGGGGACWQLGGGVGGGGLPPSSTSE